MCDLRRHSVLLVAAMLLGPAAAAAPRRSPSTAARSSLHARSRTGPPAAVLGLSVTPLRGGARLTVRCSAPVRATVAKAGSTLTLSIPGSRLGRVPRLLRPGRGGVVAVRALGYGRGRAAGAAGVRFRVELQARYAARLTRSGRRGTVALEVHLPAAVAAAAPRRSAVALRDGEPLRHVRESADADERPGGTVARITAIKITGDEDETEVEIAGRGSARPKIQRLLGRRSHVVLNLAPARLAIAGVPAPPPDSMLRRIRAAQLTDRPAACRIILDLKPGASVETGSTRGSRSSGALLRLHIRSRKTQRAITARRKRGPIIAIDPGHGGLDSGAVNGGLRVQEKDVTLDIARRMEALLERAGYRVVMSRTGDERLKPDQRKEWLARLHATVLVSIHCDSVDDRPGWSGATTYFHAGSGPGQQLASDIQQALVGATGTPDRGVRPDNSRYESGFYLLRDSRQPAVLVETGYISHPQTALAFKNPAYCEQVARGIARGLRVYLKDEPQRQARR